MEKSQSIIIILAIMLFFCGCEKPPLKDFEPLTPNESAIKNTLITFRDSANNRDAQGVLDVIHQSAHLMVGRDRVLLTKEEYAKVLPIRLVENPGFELSIPKIEISGSKAHVRIYMARGDSNFLFIIDMDCENQDCLITNWEF